MTKYFFSIIILFLFDRLSKVYILKNPSFFSGTGFFDLHINKNIAFSLPLASWLLYPLVILVVFGLIFFWIRSFREKGIFIWPLGLIILGAISNVIDRFRYGGVIDFISVPYFTVFNFSDIYISIGVVWILFYSWFYKKYE